MTCIPLDVSSWHNPSSVRSSTHNSGTLHFLCLGSPPFDNHRTRLEQDSTSRLEYPNWLSSNLSQWVQSCFADDSADRPEARALFQEAERHVDSKDLQRVTLNPAGSILGDTLPSALLPRDSEMVESRQRWKSATSDSQSSGSWHGEEGLGKGTQTPGSASTNANSSERYESIQNQLSEHSPSGAVSSTTQGESKNGSDPTFRLNVQGIQSQTSSSPVASSVSTPLLASSQVTSPDDQRVASAPIPENLPRVSVDSYYLQNPGSKEHDRAPRHQKPSDTRTLANESFRSDQSIVSKDSVSPRTALIQNLGGLLDGLPDRYPHFGVFYGPPDKSRPDRDIHTERLTRAIAVSGSIKEGNVQVENRNVNRQSKGGIHRFFSGSKTSRPESPDLRDIQVSLEASESHEYLLLNNEEYFQFALKSADVRAWILRKQKFKKQMYLIVGYLTYVDATVSNENNSEKTKIRSMVVGSPVSQAASSNPGSGRSSSNGQNIFVRDGERVQAGHFREIDLPRASEDELDMSFIHDSKKIATMALGDVFTVYFWGPKRRPLQ